MNELGNIALLPTLELLLAETRSIVSRHQLLVIARYTAWGLLLMVYCALVKGLRGRRSRFLFRSPISSRGAACTTHGKAGPRVLEVSARSRVYRKATGWMFGEIKRRPPRPCVESVSASARLSSGRSASASQSRSVGCIRPVDHFL